MSDIDNEATGVTEGHSPLHPFGASFEIFFVFRNTAGVSRAEDFCLRLNREMIVRDDPVVLEHSVFLNLVLVLAVADGSGPGSKDNQDGIALVS